MSDARVEWYNEMDIKTKGVLNIARFTGQKSPLKV